MCEVSTSHASNARTVLRLFYEDCAEDPRSAFDNLGTMVCWARRGTYGDPHDFEDPEAFLRAHHRDSIVLPINIYEHGLIALSTRSFTGRVPGYHDIFDCALLGFIYVPKERIREEYGWTRITPARRHQIEEYLEGEIREYQDYLNGHVFAYQVVRVTKCPQCGQDEEEILDSCGGFYGADPERSGIRDAIGEDLWSQLEDTDVAPAA